MKRFIRNPKTGILEVWDEGKKVGEIATMGDTLEKDSEQEKTDKKE